MIPQVTIDPQFSHTFSLLIGRLSDRILEIINIDRKSILLRFSFCHSIGHLWKADAHSFLGMHFYCGGFENRSCDFQGGSDF